MSHGQLSLLLSDPKMFKQKVSAFPVAKQLFCLPGVALHREVAQVPLKLQPHLGPWGRLKWTNTGGWGGVAGAVVRSGLGLAQTK